MKRSISLVLLFSLAFFAHVEAARADDSACRNPESAECDALLSSISVQNAETSKIVSQVPPEVTKAAPSGAVPGPASAAKPQKKAGKDTKPAAAVAPSAGTKPKPAEAATKPPPPPPPPASAGSIQARAALQESEAAWRRVLTVLEGLEDKASRRKVLPHYVMAATTYLQALTLWGDPNKAKYVEILAPVVQDEDARASLDISVSGARLHKMLADPATAKALTQYVETSINLGRSVPPERAQKMKEAVQKGFSKDGLDNLITAWGQQQAEALASDLNQLASVGEQLSQKPDESRETRLVLVTASSAPPDASGIATCTDEVVSSLEKQLKVIYGPHLAPVVELGTLTGVTPGVFTSNLKGELAKAKCAQCDGAIGILATPEGSGVRLDTAFVFPGTAAKPVGLERSRFVDCSVPEAAVLAAGSMFKELLENRTLIHDAHPPLFASRRLYMDAGSVPSPTLACGSAETLPAKNPGRRGIAIQGKCNDTTTDALRDVLKQQSKIGIIAKPESGDLVITLEQKSSVKCEAKVTVGGNEYFHPSVETKTPAQDTEVDRTEARSHNAAAGDRLAMCLAGYYFEVRGRETPPITVVKARTPGFTQALLAPGTPLLDDADKSNDWAGYTWLVGDSVALASSIGFAFASINARNAVADHPSQDLNTANAFLAISLSSALVVVASRVVSVSSFGFKSEEKPPTAASEPALFQW
jgi:hypothetical protein